MSSSSRTRQLFSGENECSLLPKVSKNTVKTVYIHQFLMAPGRTDSGAYSGAAFYMYYIVTTSANKFGRNPYVSGPRSSLTCQLHFAFDVDDPNVNGSVSD